MKFSRIFTFMFLFFLMFTYPVFADNGDSKDSKIQLEVVPNKVLFNIKNFAPGDWSTRSIVIKNTGSVDFYYNINANFITGSEKVYNTLLLEINSKEKSLYKGKLKDFQGLNRRGLVSQKDEELKFTVKMPSDLGNDFQGLKCIVQFEFDTEGVVEGLSPLNGSSLPNTGSNIFNIMIIGLVLIFSGIFLQWVIDKSKKVEKQV